jgi:membrane-bound lytic murein transglycosylase D
MHRFLASLAGAHDALPRLPQGVRPVLFVLLASLLAGAGPVGAAPHDLPRPAALAPRIAFWTRIYTEVGTNGGLLHDSRDLSIVYEVIDFPAGLSNRARDARIRARREYYEGILRKLGAGRRSGLSSDEQRVLASLGDGATNATLREASHRVRFQLGQANKFREGLHRQGRWRSYVEGVLAQRGLPVELAALPHVESSYNPEAHSHAGASGLWQFTSSTGRLFMQVDHVVDERRDPYLATVAAARLLKQNYDKVGSWPLAITAYNHGAAGMARAVRTLGTNDIATIIERYSSRTFGFASRNFYVEFLAALDVQTNAERHFGPIRPDPPEDLRIVPLDHYYKAPTVASALGVSLDELRAANPALLSPIWAGQKLLPRGYGLRVPAANAVAAPRTQLASVPGSERFAKQLPDRSYRVRRGDSLSRIARRFGVRESDLVAMNGLRSRNRIRAGQVLRLPVQAGSAPVAVASSAGLEPLPADGLYQVRRGDTLGRIARRFGVSEGDLASDNGLRDRNLIQPGQVLQIPGGASTARAGASTAGVYVVHSGDTLEGIARRFGLDVSVLKAHNGLRNANRIQVGQRIYLPGSTASPRSSADSGAKAPAGGAPGPASAAQTPPAALAQTTRPPDQLPLTPDRYKVGLDGRAEVQPDETLGLFASWCGVSVADLRRVNGVHRSTVRMGERVVLDLSRVSRGAFERSRLAHHRALQTAFYGRYAVEGTREVVIQAGDTLLSVARSEGEIPIWLLLAYNPDLEPMSLRQGQTVRVPKVVRRG